MPNFTYNTDIPDAPNDPSNDQPKMKTNTNNIDGIWAVDHVSFNTDDGGTHLQVSLSSKNVPGVQSGEQSVIYSDDGIIDASRTELYFRNPLAAASTETLPLSLVKAYACCDSTGAVLNGRNITFNSNPGTGQYIYDLPANLVTSSPNYGILLSCTRKGAGGALNDVIGTYLINTAVQFTLFFANKGTNTGAAPNFFTVIVLQI
jgi:hypothetical protein